MTDGAGATRNLGPLRSIVIVGGGTAGWMAATLLARKLDRQSVTITVVESSDIRTVGVGEATVPGIRDFFREIGVSEQEVMAGAQGTVKLGIEFVDWKREGERFFHPFGLYGMRSRGVAFHHYWRKLNAAGRNTPLSDFCLATALAERNLFMRPTDSPVHDLLFFDWAVHFDAGLFAKFLSKKAGNGASSTSTPRSPMFWSIKPRDSYPASIRSVAKRSRATSSSIARAFGRYCSATRWAYRTRIGRICFHAIARSRCRANEQDRLPHIRAARH